jgi:hypothetical protein
MKRCATDELLLTAGEWLFHALHISSQLRRRIAVAWLILQTLSWSGKRVVQDVLSQRAVTDAAFEVAQKGAVVFKQRV